MKKAKAPQAKPEIVRSYAHDEKAMKRLVALGVPKGKIYLGYTKAEHWEKITMRNGEGLGVIDGLRAFGTHRTIKKAVAQFHGQGAVIIDHLTGQNSLTDGVAMFDDATGPRKPSAEYDKISKSEAADARRKKNGQMLYHDAHTIWFNPKLKIAEKIKLTKWSKGALYAEFKKSNGPTGRPPKQPI